MGMSWSLSSTSVAAPRLRHNQASGQYPAVGQHTDTTGPPFDRSRPRISNDLKSWPD